MVKEIRNDDIDALVIVPLYPQFSISTSGSSLRALAEEFAKCGDSNSKMTQTVIPSWHTRPGYVASVSNLIQNEIDLFTQEQLEEGGDVHILFSAHGVPESYIEAGDPYQSHIMECVELITSKLLQLEPDSTCLPQRVLKRDNVHLSYQSRVGPIQWLRPYTDTVLPELGADGVKNLVVVPISFVSEHVETLEEIDIEYRELAEENGIENWRRCPALNTDAGFLDDMANMVIEALSEPVQTGKLLYFKKSKSCTNRTN